MRKYYLDNLRAAVILLLFPVHTFMIYNDYGSKFYIWPEANRLVSTLIVVINPWFMPLLFLIAGMSAKYALESRSVKAFIGERITKLFVPLIFGLLILIPLQTLYARKYFYGYTGSLWENEKYFFTHLTDFSGYDGAFTPGHLWFIFFLLLISLVSLPLCVKVTYNKVKDQIDKLHVGIVIGMFLIVWLTYYIGNIGGYSIGKNLTLYLLGYYVLNNETVQAKLDKYRKIIAATFLLSDIALAIAYYQWAYYGDLLVNFVGWMGILTMLIYGKRIWNRTNRVLTYFGRASYPVYILHQTILVVIAYYVVQNIDGLLLQIIIILSGSFLMTLLCYEIICRIPYIRNLIGINKKQLKKR